MVDAIDLFNTCLFIQDNLDADLSLMFLAQAVGLSRFRFHRVFKAWRGETLHDFVTRMRMERAAFELSYPVPRSNRRSIKAIAFASGYKSLSSFSHAFSAYARLSPRAFRNRALRGRGVAASGRDAVQFLAPYSITIREEPARNVAVYDHGGGGVSRKRNVPNAFHGSPRGQIFGVESLPGLFVRARCDTPLAERSTMMTCFGVEASDWQDRQEVAPRTTLALAAGRYAVIDGRGSFAALYRAWRRGFDAWLINNGECPRADRLFARFHSGLPSGLLDPARITLYVPLEPLAIETSGRRNGKRGAAPKTQAVVQLQASV